MKRRTPPAPLVSVETAPASPPAVDPPEAQQMLEKGAVLVDVREPWELEQLRVPGAVHIPLMELPGRLHELPTQQTLVCMCKSGARSDHAARMLAAAGVPDVLNLAGGILAWHAAGLPTTRGPLDD